MQLYWRVINIIVKGAGAGHGPRDTLTTRFAVTCPAWFKCEFSHNKLEMNVHLMKYKYISTQHHCIGAWSATSSMAACLPDALAVWAGLASF